MITINNKIKETNFLKISIDGSFNDRDIDKLIPLLYNARDRELNLLVVIGDLDIVSSMNSISEKLKAEMVFLKKISRCVLVTDKKWLRWIAKIEKLLLPAIEIKTFPLNEQDKAKQWLLA